MIDREVSLVADQAYSESGVSLYDAVTLTSKDRDTVERFIRDAVSLLARRMADVSRVQTDAGSDLIKLTIDVDDWVGETDADAADAAVMDLERYIVLHAVTAIFQDRRAAVVPTFAERTQAMMDNVVTNLRTRKAPSRTS